MSIFCFRENLCDVCYLCGCANSSKTTVRFICMCNMYMCVCARIWMCMCVFVYVYVCMCKCVVSAYMCLYIHLQRSQCICLSILVFICLYGCPTYKVCCREIIGFLDALFAYSEKYVPVSCHFVLSTIYCIDRGSEMHLFAI